MNKSKLRDKYVIFHGDSGDLVAGKEEIKSGKSLLEVGVPLWDFIDQSLAQNRKAILEEVRSILPKEIENHYGMVSPDVGYNQAIKEMRQKLSILEGETK